MKIHAIATFYQCHANYDKHFQFHFQVSAAAQCQILYYKTVPTNVNPIDKKLEHQILEQTYQKQLQKLLVKAKMQMIRRRFISYSLYKVQVKFYFSGSSKFYNIFFYFRPTDAFDKWGPTISTIQVNLYYVSRLWLLVTELLSQGYCSLLSKFVFVPSLRFRFLDYLLHFHLHLQK